MSTEHDAGAHPRSEDDHVDGRAVLLVGVGALLVFTVAAFAAMGFMKKSQAERPPPPLPGELGQTKIGLVEQQLFESGPLRGDRARAAQVARLTGAGWVDRAAGVAHIPIDAAMALVSQGVRTRAGDLPAPPPLGADRGGVDAPSVPIAQPPAPPPAQGKAQPPAKGTAQPRPAAKGGPK